MFGTSVLICTFLPALVLSTQTRPLEKRQSCPASCSGCCDALPPAGCYAPVSGPGAGQYACYSYPPGEVVSTQLISGSYSGVASSGAYYPSSEPYGSYSSSVAFPSYSSPYYSSSDEFSNGPAPTPYRSHHHKVPTVTSSAGPSSSATAVPGTGAADNNSVAFSCLMVVCGVVWLAVPL